jgi:FkbM family methyltransferase
VKLADRARHAVQCALGYAGFELRRSGRGPRRTLEEVARNARAAGVAAGTPGLYDVWPTARLLLVEPLAEWEGVMREIAAGRGSFVVAAAGAASGEAELHVHRVLALSSLVGDPDPGRTTPRVVDVVSIDAVAGDMPGPLVVKVDVQGGELDVLRGAAETLQRTELVLLETSLVELIPGQSLLHEVVAFMATRGFVVYDVFGGHLRPLDGALAQLDLAFARVDGVLRRDRRYATAEQAEALFRSWGG